MRKDAQLEALELVLERSKGRLLEQIEERKKRKLEKPPVKSPPHEEEE